MIMMLNTTDLKPGYWVRLVDYGQTDIFFRRKLLSFGLTRGVELLVVRVAPMGCPIQLDIRGTSLALRKEEACYLQWEQLRCE